MQIEVTRHLSILGRVQGVTYRASLRTQADRLGVQGWVRNRRDGSVEALVQGEAAAVRALIDWAHRGPGAAFVEAVHVKEAEPEALTGFEQRATV